MLPHTLSCRGGNGSRDVPLRFARAPLALALAACAWTTPATVAAAPGAPESASAPLPPVPADPDDAPFMAPKNGGARPVGRRRWNPKYGGGYRRYGRLQLTLKPLFASFRRAFLGRPSNFGDPQRGGGAGADIDVRIFGPFNLRLTGSYSGHPVPDAFARDDKDALQKTANSGTIHAGHLGASLAYALDVGRIAPTIDLGAGLLWVKTPAAAIDGQTGGSCTTGGGCDLGLGCAPATNTCEPIALPVVHGGLAVDGLVTDRITLGLGLRYFAFLTAPAEFPIYLQAAARLGIRF